MAAKGQRIGYVRVSSADQNEDRQLELMEDLDRIFTDKASGKNTARPKLQELLNYAREGDTIVVHSMDRLARSTASWCLAMFASTAAILAAVALAGRAARTCCALASLRPDCVRCFDVQHIDGGPAGTLATFLKYGMPANAKLSVHAILTPFGGDEANLTAMIERSDER